MSIKEQNNKAKELITNQICELIEQSGKLPWSKPWSMDGEDIPHSIGSGKAYNNNGILFMLHMSTIAQGFTSNWWGTFKALKQKGLCVKKGEKSTIIYWWKKLSFKVEDEEAEEGLKTISRWALQTARVFNAEQCKGKIPTNPRPVTEKVLKVDFQRVQEAMKALVDYRDRESISYGEGGKKAYYSPSSHSIQMPHARTFKNPEAFCAVLAHESAHSTMHKLERKASNSIAAFGDEVYSQEELTAEFTSAIFMGMNGLSSPELVNNSAAYIKGWVGNLRKNKSWIVNAISESSEAMDFIMTGELPSRLEK